MKLNLLIKNSKLESLKRWSYVIAGIIIMMCIGTVYSYGIFRHSIEIYFNVGTTQSGMPYMTALALYALFVFITGRFLDKYNPRYIMTVGGLILSLGWILSAFAQNINILTLTYGIISGAGVGIIYGVPMTVVSKWFPEKKGLAVGMVLSGFGLSPLLTAPLARSFIGKYGIMNTFLILGICFGILIPLLSFLFKYPTEVEQLNLKTITHAKKNLNEFETSSMIKSKSFKGLYFNFIIGTTIGLMLIGLTSSIGIELIGLSHEKVALLIALFAIFNGIGRPTFGWIIDKSSSRKAMLLSYVIIVLATILIMMANLGSVTIYAISFSMYWFSLGGWLAIAPATTLVLYGTKHYSQNYGVVFTAYGIGAITGVVTSGILIDVHKNYHFVFYYVIVLCLIGIILTTKLIKD